ncbi:MAG: hypothetical protein FWC20_10425 [Oscillospiraceae bacterium]|nr:hypothetical protein [Oscillospiraceae bacterium]MCL2279803.1 hypothetical protein [Oscillospiraceae bacterium]
MQKIIAYLCAFLLTITLTVNLIPPHYDSSFPSCEVVQPFYIAPPPNEIIKK